MKKKSVQMTQEELVNKTIRRIYNRGKRKGYVSPEYIEKTIKNKDIPREKVEEILEVFKEEDIKVMDEAQAALMPVVKKKRGRKKGSTNKKSNKNLDGSTEELEDGDDILGKTDDPVRMYLREMGGVELLSREGEIAIAKRIEASRSTMMVGIFGSPTSLEIIADWQKKLSKGDMLLREIIDCESTYNKTPEGKANVKTADNALDATSGKLMLSKNLVNSNFDADIDEAKKEPEGFNKKGQITYLHSGYEEGDEKVLKNHLEIDGLYPDVLDICLRHSSGLSFLQSILKYDRSTCHIFSCLLFG